MRGNTPKIFHILKFAVLGTLFAAALGFAVMTLWNCLIPDLFHGPVVTFWQAIGLILLGKLLFGWHGGGHGWKNRGPEQWRKKMQDRMQHMTPEEREKMRQRLKSCMPARRWSNWAEEKTEKGTEETTSETNI